MLEFVKGNMFEDSCEALVNTVNCVGVMGRGVALQFKKRFPENFKAYERACREGRVTPGKMLVFDTGMMIGPRWLVNFPTKRHWKCASRIEDIAAGLDDFVKVVAEKGISSVSLPPLGCGLGGLEWSTVRALMVEKLSALPQTVRVLVHEPLGAPEALRNVPLPQMSRTVASIILLVKGYLDAMLDPMITLIEVQKLMYFLQVMGEDLNLRYQKYHYGPYAGNLRFVLCRIEGHYLRGYGDGGEMPDKPLVLLPGAVEDAVSYIERFPETRDRINGVLQLVHGLETPDSMELLASVHWVVEHEGVSEFSQLVQSIHGWDRNTRKTRFSVRQIEMVDTVLRERLPDYRNRRHPQCSE